MRVTPRDVCEYQTLRHGGSYSLYIYVIGHRNYGNDDKYAITY